LLVGAILHVLYAEPDKTRPASRLSCPIPGVPVIASAARELLNKSDNERSDVLSTAMSFLGLYRDPVVARVCGIRKEVFRRNRTTSLTNAEQA